MNRRQAEQAAYRDQVIARALTEGKILAASKLAWEERFDRDPEGTEKLLAKLAGNPTVNAGASSAAVATAGGAATDAEMSQMFGGDWSGRSAAAGTDLAPVEPGAVAIADPTEPIKISDSEMEAMFSGAFTPPEQIAADREGQRVAAGKHFDEDRRAAEDIEVMRKAGYGT
jgi:hypothetical protein